MYSKLLFRASATIEILTGIALLFVPLLIIELLLGEGSNDIGVAVARVLGIGLLSLGVSTWEASTLAPKIGICLYNIGVAILFIFLNYSGIHGILIWPAILLHGVMGLAMLVFINQ